MNKKGFTLIELLAVVTIITLISLIAIPNITKNIREKKTEISEANQKLLASATDVYIENNKNYDNSYEANGSTYCITLQTLIDNNYLETPFKDVNGTEIDYTKQVQATFQAEYNSFNYEIVDSCEEIKQYVSRPNLTENMIPVIYDETTNTWKKADKNSHWYNYSEKKWANAVLVKETKSDEENSKSRYQYKESPAGTPILESDVLAYFTWIPRFRYQLFESNEPQTINIVFESISSPKSRGTEKNQWLTHPAFTYNNQELSGIWVAKYETSNQDDNIIIKSEQTPWTNIGFNDATNKSNSMINTNNIYGLNNVNTHLTQNNEWSAITYLTQSIYGLNDRVNTNSSTTTGGTNSTTGNIYGIYDMAGLSKEFVTITGENENSLGYSLNETKTWYDDTNTFISTENAYLARGNTSIFNYNASNVKNSDTSFRPIIINNEVSSDNQNTSLQYAYLNISTNSYYSTLSDALSEAHDGDTVKVLGNITDTSWPIVDEGKTLIIEIPNGYTVALSDHFIDNDGTLIVKGAGTLTSTVCAIRNDGTLNVQDGVSINGIGTGITSTINNFGIMTVTDATITSDAYRAIYNQATGTLVIANDSNITAYGYAIYNINATANSISDPAVKIEGGTIQSTNAYTIHNAASGMIYLSGGTIKQANASGVINNKEGGTIQVSGATIEHTATAGHAISSVGGQVTITAGTVSTNGGVIQGTSSTNTNSVRAISTSGNFTMSGGTVTSSFSEAVYVSGSTVNVTGGTIEKGPDINGTNHSGSVFAYGGTGTATLSSGVIKTLSGSGSTTVNKNNTTGIIQISGATIQNLGTGLAVYNQSTTTSEPTIVINSGTIEANTTNAVLNNSTGKIEILGGNMSSISGDAIRNASTGSIDISGGTIISTNKAGISLGNGTMSITGGTVTGATYGVWMNENNATTLNLGTDDGIVKSVPTITGTNSNGKGIVVGIGTLNFYDGTVTGGYSSGTGYSIPVGGTINPAGGYSISKTNNGSKETAILKAN